MYIATERKGGGFGAPAEIWFMWDRGAVWVASPPTTWRAKRIRAGRTDARIYVGKKDGPLVVATGSFVRDPAAYDRPLRDLRQEISGRLAEVRSALPRRVEGREPGPDPLPARRDRPCG